MAVYFITAISPFTIRSLFMKRKFPTRRHEQIVSSFCRKGNKCLQISSDFVLFWPRGNFLFAAYRHHPPQHFFPTHQVAVFCRRHLSGLNVIDVFFSSREIYLAGTWNGCIQRFIVLSLFRRLLEAMTYTALPYNLLQ